MIKVTLGVRCLVPLASCLVAVTLSGCIGNQTKLGGGGTEVSGSGGRAGAEDSSDQLVRCAKPIGTAALLEPQNTSYGRYGLSSPVPLVKLIMAQSNCFQVVSRGASSSALEKERALASGGELQKGSAMGGGQMKAADYIIEPAIVHRDEDSGGGSGGLGAFLPGVVGAVAGALDVQNMEAQTLLSVTNVRTGVQEAIAEGSASKRDVGFGGGGFLGTVGGFGGAYEDTDIGKITTAAFLDAHNKLVNQLGAIPAGEAAAADNAGYMTSTAVNFRSGPNTSAPVISTLQKGATVMPTGEKQGSWWQVEAQGRTGWLHSDYITR